MTVVARRFLIRGRVQGVGYRDWMVGEAARLGVAGWVRNRGADAVEAVVGGTEAAVAALHAACLRGPPLASVTAIEVAEAMSPNGDRFERRASC